MRHIAKATNVLHPANQSLGFAQTSILPRTLMMGGAITTMVLLTGCNPTQATQDANAAVDNKNISLLNVSYDVSRDFYKEYN
uniref:hypothetical protein n=1 Tax=Shewanella sp. CAL98-MNA-CIBAN-0140 TaxID=3140462 RepID=UPI0033227DBE